MNQLVATDASGAVIGRSQNYSDVTLLRCAPIEQPVVENTPTLVIPNITPIRPGYATPTIIR